MELSCHDFFPSRNLLPRFTVSGLSRPVTTATRRRYSLVLPSIYSSTFLRLWDNVRGCDLTTFPSVLRSCLLQNIITYGIERYRNTVRIIHRVTIAQIVGKGYCVRTLSMRQKLCYANENLANSETDARFSNIFFFPRYIRSGFRFLSSFHPKRT